MRGMERRWRSQKLHRMLQGREHGIAHPARRVLTLRHKGEWLGSELGYAISQNSGSTRTGFTRSSDAGRVAAARNTGLATLAASLGGDYGWQRALGKRCKSSIS